MKTTFQAQKKKIKKNQKAVTSMTEQHLVQNASSSSMEMRGKSITEEIIQRFSSNKKILTLSRWDNLGHF